MKSLQSQGYFFQDLSMVVITMFHSLTKACRMALNNSKMSTVL